MRTWRYSLFQRSCLKIRLLMQSCWDFHPKLIFLWQIWQDTDVRIISLSIIADQFLFPFALLFFLLAKTFLFCVHTYIPFHTYTHRQMYTQRELHNHRSTHSLVRSQLMKWLVRCPMCRTYGSLPIRWITLNRRAHSSADMIVLMDGNNIQTAAWSHRLRVNASIFLWWRGEVCLFLSLCFYFLSRPCVFVFRRVSRGVAQTAPPARHHHMSGPLCLLIHRCNSTC